MARAVQVTACWFSWAMNLQIQTRSTLSELSASLDETREVATDLSIEHQRLAAELERMERAVAMSNGKPLPSLPPRPGTLRPITRGVFSVRPTHS